MELSKPLETPQAAPKRLLIAEDNPGDVHLVRLALARHGLECELDWVADGEKAINFIDAVEKDPEVPCPDLVLLDLNLPRHVGSEILVHLRRGARCGRVPVLVVSSAVSPRERASMQQLGASEYFSKPSDLDKYMELGVVIKRMLGGGPRSEE